MKEGIWKYSKISKLIDPSYRLSLGEGSTPIEKKDIDGEQVFFKREDLNPNRSFKDRGVAFQISFYRQEFIDNLVISSSGNAATSAIAYSKLANLNLSVFVSTEIPNYKLELLESIANDKVKIVKSLRAKSDAFKYAKRNNAVNLRGSTDSLAHIGYKTISYELYDQVPDADAIFICCSSGTSTLGIFEGYLDKLWFKTFGRKIPQVHIVQTSKINPIAKQFDSNFAQSKSSLANAVSDNVAHRRKQILEIIGRTHGSGWVVEDRDLELAKEKLKLFGYNIEGYNAYVAFAGYLKAIKSGLNFKSPVCIISGI